MAIKIERERATKVKITTGQAATTAKQAASWRRLWETLLSQGEIKRGEDKNGNNQGMSQ